MSKLKIFYGWVLFSLAIVSVASNNSSHNLGKISSSNNKGVTFTGETTVTVPIRDQNSDKSTKEIKLLDVDLSDEYKQKITKKFAKDGLADLTFNFNNLNDSQEIIPNFNVNDFQLDNGMNNVPVLDQGKEGTCVTFAATAAINAKMAAGDFISQQCLLELGVFLAKADPKVDSGWNGTTEPETILRRMLYFGVMEKNSCPHSYANNSFSMTPSKYMSYSNHLWADQIEWEEIEEDSISKLKNILDKGHRVVLATLLNKTKPLGSPINDASNGLWKLPKYMPGDLYIFYLMISKKLAGHAVVVTGYDDQKRLLKIRNSWGATAGDQGNYYMTYDFYEAMNIKAVEII